MPAVPATNPIVIPAVPATPAVEYDQVDIDGQFRALPNKDGSYTILAKVKHSRVLPDGKTLEYAPKDKEDKPFRGTAEEFAKKYPNLADKVAGFKGPVKAEAKSTPVPTA